MPPASYSSPEGRGRGVGRRPGVRPKGAISTYLLIIAVAALVTLILYARSFALPFYSDDLVQIPWLRSLSFADLWRQVSPYGYYRPLAFSLWLAIRDLGLAWTPAGLRLLNLMLHTVASSLVGWLALEIDADRRALGGIFAAMLFAAFPFAYQAIPWVSAVFYPLMISLTLVAVIGYLRFRRTGSQIWLAISLIGTALAPFAHENGILVGALILLTKAVLWLESRCSDEPQHPSVIPLAHLVISSIFLVLWFSLRRGGVSTLDLSAGGLFNNLTILAMGVSFPVAWIAQVLAGPGSLSPSPIVWILTLASVIILASIPRRSPGVSLFCAGWFLLSIGPILVTMRPEWLIDAPRFFYPAGVGAALWWGFTISRLDRETLPSRGLAVGVAFLATLPGAIFIWWGLDWHLRGASPIWDAVHAAQSDEEKSLLLVNLPDRLTPSRSLYPFFNGGAILLPPQIDAPNIVSAHTGNPRVDRAATAGFILPQIPYLHGVYGTPFDVAEIESGRSVMIAAYGESISLRKAGEILQQDPPAAKPVAFFDRKLVLIRAESHVEGSVLVLRLVWQLNKPLDGMPTVFIHIADSSGAVVAQGDGDPIGGLYPFYLWQPNRMVEDIRYITLPGSGPYTIYVGVWLPTTGKKLPTDPPYPDDRVPIGAVP